MREKLVVVILVTALFTAAFGIAFRITPVPAPPGGQVRNVPFPYPTLANAVSNSNPNDEIHIAAGHFEALAGPLNIAQNNLWIIGAPPGLGPTPTIDLNGFTITVTANFGVFIWGLNIIDTGGAPVGIILAPAIGNHIIRGNTITGLVPASTGIQVFSSYNHIELNTMSTWGVCIDLIGPLNTGNLVVANTINPPYNWGIQVSGGTGFNQIYYNNMFGPGGGMCQELFDASPGGSPPNWFDDTTGGGPSHQKGNFEWSWPGPAPYPVPGPNGYTDNWPLNPNPWVQIPGDINLDAAVDVFDIVWVAAGFGTAWCQLGWDPRADLNGDGLIDIFDIVIVAMNFGMVDP